jgi:hypothetical protein
MKTLREYIDLIESAQTVEENDDQSIMAKNGQASAMGSNLTSPAEKRRKIAKQNIELLASKK